MITVDEYVDAICLGLPETEKVISHGSPTYKADGKAFATYTINHHGDQRIALLLNLGKDTQSMLVSSAPDIFYVPPYTGGKGWVGAELNKGLAWPRLAELTYNAFSRVVSASLANSAQPIDAPAPTQAITPEDIDPMLKDDNQVILGKLRALCTALPEVVEDTQFGAPNFRAGKKSFCNLTAKPKALTLQVWVGAEQQASLADSDQRFRIPPYVGHRGWIDLDLTDKQDWTQIEALVLESYRHFALKRMLNALD